MALKIEPATQNRVDRTTDGFAIRLFDLRLRVETDSPAIFGAVDQFLFPWLPRLPLLPDSAIQRPPLTFRIEQRAGLVVIIRDDESEITAKNVETAIPLLQGAIDEAVVRTCSNFAFVHAGVVAIGDAGILLPGISHAGKSTLVSELVQRGATYFSDEYAVIETDGFMQPYPRALMLRNGQPEQRAVLPSQLAARVGTAGVAVRLILTLRYDPSEHFRVRTMNSSETLMSLLQSTPQVLADAPHIFRPLSRISGTADAFSGVRGEAGPAAEQILSLAAQLCKTK